MRDDGRGRSAARSSRNARSIDGIPRGPVKRIDRRHAAAELVGVGLAEQHGAGAFEQLHDRRVRVRDVFVVDHRAGGGAHAPRLEEILVGDRDPPHRPLRIVVERLRFAAREVGGDGDEGVQILVQLADARQVRVGELHRRDRSRSESTRCFSDGQCGQIIRLSAKTAYL